MPIEARQRFSAEGSLRRASSAGVRASEAMITEIAALFHELLDGQILVHPA